MSILIFMFLFSGILLAALAIPLIMGKIPPNGLYGFRVKKTMENPEIWYPVNAYAGKWLLAIGIGVAATAAGLSYIPGISLDIYAYAELAVWIVMFSVAMIASIRKMNSL